MEAALFPLQSNDLLDADLLSRDALCSLIHFDSPLNFFFT